MPFMAMVSSVGSNDVPEMYNYLGGVKNDKRSENLDDAFKQEKSNFSIVIVVDMWITGFDVPALTYLYNDKPLKKHVLIQTISRVNRKYPGNNNEMMMLESVKTTVSIIFFLYSLKIIYFVVTNEIILVAKEFTLNKTIIHLVFNGASKKKFPINNRKGN